MGCNRSKNKPVENDEENGDGGGLSVVHPQGEGEYVEPLVAHEQTPPINIEPVEVLRPPLLNDRDPASRMTQKRDSRLLSPNRVRFRSGQHLSRDAWVQEVHDARQQIDRGYFSGDQNTVQEPYHFPGKQHRVQE